MTFISQIAPEELFRDVPDFCSWNEASAWIDAERSFSPKAREQVAITSFEWRDFAKEGCFGYYQDPLWRKFVLAIFAADLISYPEVDDQVTFDRLLFVMHSFPQGFRLWCMQGEDKKWHPIGYTGWYPMHETIFAIFQNSPEKIQNRCVVPCPNEPYLYLFNFSVAPHLKIKELTKPLMTRFVEDIKKQKAKGLACITVSDDGKRQAERLGMHAKSSGIYSSS